MALDKQSFMVKNVKNFHANYLKLNRLKWMGMNFFIKFSILILLCSCAQRMKIPINRFSSPEVIGGGVGVEYQSTGFSVGQLDFSNNDVDNPLVVSTTTEESFHLDLGVVDKMDIFIDVPKQSSSRVGVKIQLLGDPEKAKKEGHQFAFTLATGSAHDEFESGFTIDLKSRMQDYSIIHGYRINEVVAVYEGISLTTFEFDGKIQNPGSLNGNTIDYKAKDTLGVFAGLTFGTTGIKAKAEFAGQYVRWTNTDPKLVYSFGYSLMAYW